MEEPNVKHSRHKKHSKEAEKLPVQEDDLSFRSRAIDLHSIRGHTNISDEDEVVEAPRRTHKKHPKSKPESSFITSVLEELGDDVLKNSSRQLNSGEVVTPWSPAHSSPPDKVFVQSKNGFTPASRAKLFQLEVSKADLKNDSISRRAGTPLELAILLQRGTRAFYTFCHGLLAGLALILGIMVVSAQAGEEHLARFVDFFSIVARIIQSLFFILTAICVVSIFDRCDLAHVQLLHIRDMLHYRLGDFVLLLIYPCTLVLTLVATRGDDLLSLHHHNESHWDYPEVVTEELREWSFLNLFRCLGGFFGWICILFFPAEDMLYLHLSNMIKYQQPLSAKQRY